MQPLFAIPEIDEEKAYEPVKVAYPESPGGPRGLPPDLTDVLRTKVGNTQGPIPQQQLNQMSPSQLRALKNKRFEDAAGWAKPLAQLFNAVTSPAVGEGMILGIPNALAELGRNTIDAVVGLPSESESAEFGIEYTPTPQIPRDALAGINPLREGDTADTPADQYGYEIGAESAAEVAGFATGSGVLRRLPQATRLANAIRRTRTAKSLAVAGSQNRTIRRGINLARFGGEALFDNALSQIYSDPSFGNAADLTSVVGISNPLQTNENDDYWEAQRKKFIADSLFIFKIAGAGQALPPVRRLADGDMAFGLEELARVELEPYVPRQITQPQLPPASSVDQQFDSAIDRTTSAQLQAQQVAQQQERINAMFPGLRELNSDQLAMDITAAGGTGTGNKLSKVETPEGEVVPGGPEFEFKQRPKQGALDLGEFGDAPDPRPEISTYLAELDELDDAGLRRVLGNVDQTEQINLRQQSLDEAQARVTEAEAQIASVQERLALPEGSKRKLTEQGSKRLLNKANKELEAARLQVSNQSAEPFTAASVGDQLAMELQDSLDLNTAPDIQLPGLEKFEFDEATGMWRPKKADGGYPSLEAYRDDISGWNRDLLRGMASPENSPQIAALVKARTGRRVWAAKKQDIVDALVEYAGRTKRYAVDPGKQLEIPGQQGQLPVNQLVTTEEGVAIDVAFQRRGMSAAERELMKQKILQAAIDAGEVQADIIPPPARLPETEFNQGQLIETLFRADADGQFDLLSGYAEGTIPTYKAAGKSAETLIEEMRSRFDWMELDGAGQQASKKALWEKEGWNKLTWDERKRLYMLDREESGVYRGDAGEVTDVGTTVEGISNELGLMEWTPDGDVPAATADAARKAQPKPKRKRGQKKTADGKPKSSAQVRKIREDELKAEAKVAALRKELARSTCDG